MSPIVNSGNGTCSAIAPTFVSQVQRLYHQTSLVLPGTARTNLLLRGRLPTRLSRRDTQTLTSRLTTSLAPGIIIANLRLSGCVTYTNTNHSHFIIGGLRVTHDFPNANSLCNTILVNSLVRNGTLDTTTSGTTRFITLTVRGAPYSRSAHFNI